MKQNCGDKISDRLNRKFVPIGTRANRIEEFPRTWVRFGPNPQRPSVPTRKPPHSLGGGSSASPAQHLPPEALLASPPWLSTTLLSLCEVCGENSGFFYGQHEGTNARDQWQRLAGLQQWIKEVCVCTGECIFWLELSDCVGTSDPYCRLKCSFVCLFSASISFSCILVLMFILQNKQRFKTKVVDKSLAPKWDEHFKLYVYPVRAIVCSLYRMLHGISDSSITCLFLQLFIHLLKLLSLMHPQTPDTIHANFVCLASLLLPPRELLLSRCGTKTGGLLMTFWVHI